MATIRTTLVVIATLFSASLGAQGVDSTKAQLIAERPNASGTSTEVTVGVYLFDIDEIDDVRQRFNVDMFVNIAWQDPRLALPEQEQSARIRTLPLSEIWTPRGLIVNDRGLSPRLPLVADVDALGNVVYRQRLYGELAVDLDLKDFPFDTQFLPIDVISYQYNPDEVRFSPNTRIASDTEAFSAEGWSFNLLETEFREFSVPAVGVVRPRVTFVVQAKRNAQYYVLTMFLPMSLIIFMSWTAFWIQPNVVPPRIAISTASIFSLIAFGFSIRLSLPRVSYVTRADLFVIGCTLLVFLALGAAVIGSRWASADKLEQAIRLNAAIRWIYAGLFLVATTASIAI
jgi:Neurotransmitter-gated ion-channel ligand binding domain/Neurotransmitter-gated ion-channel transmembrane region